MKNVRLVRKDESAVSPVIATILLVAITVVLAAVLYVMVAVIIGPPPPSVNFLTVSIGRQGSNWLVEVVEAPGGLLPSHTYLLVRDPNGAIVLPQNTWASLTSDRWGVTKALYQDANPNSPEIRAPDGLLLDQTTYPAGSRIVISDDANILTTRSL